ncbi:hypothetical protein DXG01_010314 [Tephrocybe rancida]|nr:hypothetical protein DXG01_010314 [Tephrocybe rancida]
MGTLVTAFSDVVLGVPVATDVAFFQPEVFTSSSHTIASSARSPRRHTKALLRSWGDWHVLLLIGRGCARNALIRFIMRLPGAFCSAGFILAVGHMGYLKILYAFLQSAGIAGGQPSSSYYFVGSQADNLFHLDSHHNSLMEHNQRTLEPRRDERALLPAP